ncbi:nuclease SbcCD subunit C [Nocardioides szechwanensis]|uniref:Nuclease SbcCD subunit C n=1 Tax=Nocardioides szechwanensis TaxID=1005944 RepID=A0A1G9XD14_9ACTN|nr:SMC family ATPase [Nocardioides szechwanensis]GEP32355.1 nuclease SbcCD subunit C [Nocardioides szechwanensis]SDM94587.1 exonuclease SbcC [Nocardioides szechwanensis]
MRLHHLRATAFGPFAGTVEVDFDELSEAGLFLLSGATGAGKTSVLDAVCFALYGDVPGDRNAARRLRCDQAAPGLAPAVTLEATLAGRRWRIERSPAWERPKKRGTGTTTEQARVALFERVDGEWRHLSSRLDETGHLVSHVVGMNVAQFTQVAMLPQGRFQAFLRARSEERHAVLQQLFRTGRFADVERWLRERRVRLGRDCELAHQEVADLVSRVSEAAAEPLPADWDVRDLTEPADDGALAQWADAVPDRAQAEHLLALTEADAAQAAEVAAREAADAARDIHQRLSRYRDAVAERERLTAAAARVERDRRQLAAARSAAAVVPLLRLTQEAAAQRDELTATVATLDATDRDQLAEQVQRAVEEAAAVRALRPDAARVTALSREVAGLETRAVEISRASAEVGVLTRLAEIEARLAQHDELATVAASLVVAREEWHDAKETALALQEQLLSVREARLDSMAGEIACALAVGACCPVCGSADHPHKAAPLPGAPDAAVEKAALRAVDDAKATEHLRDVEVRDLATRRDALRALVGDESVTELHGRREAARAELATLGVRASRSGPDLEERRRRLEREAAETTARLDALEAECQRLRATVDAALSDSGFDDLESLLSARVEAAETGRLALAALDALVNAEAAYADAVRALTTSALEAGFASPEAAAGAVLDPQALGRLDAAVITHDQRVAAVDEVLRAPGVDELADVDLPDLAPLAAAHADCLSRLARSRGRLDQLSRRLTRLGGLRTDLHRSLAQWEPLRADHELTCRLASFVEGKAPDNRLRMRLSAYVLAYRLGQVVAAANERLAGMSDQRYSLVHTGDRGAGETRGGLSLLVRDDWSGETRDPATLSGGETFVVSLALALGLADVITQEVGGAALDTLFVDEGFGSLDADTLDDVMDTLDSLRDGGRVVGVVSHVAELRDRIPTQLVVAKSRQGSTLSLRR